MNDFSTVYKVELKMVESPKMVEKETSQFRLEIVALLLASCHLVNIVVSIVRYAIHIIRYVLYCVQKV